MSENKVITVAAALITDRAGRYLLVRKRNTPYFMQPGGKPEPGETPQAALVRELWEELSLEVDLADLTPLGRFEDRAANEPGHKLIADMFAITTAQTDFSPAAEIEEVIWFDPRQPGEVLLAPFSRSQLMPEA